MPSAAFRLYEVEQLRPTSAAYQSRCQPLWLWHLSFLEVVRSLRSLLLLVSLATAAAIVRPGAAAASSSESGALSLRIDGVEVGIVRATTTGDAASTKKTITVLTSEPTQALLNVVKSFLDSGNSKSAPPKRSLVLATGAVIEKANDARLIDVRLPSYAGGSSDIALVFEAPTMTTSPSLRTASDRAKPTTLKLASFRLSLGDLPTTEATRLDSLIVKAKEGAPIPQSLAFDVPSKDAPALLAWSKKPTPREGSIEYVGPTGELLLNVKIAGCTPTSTTSQGSAVKIDGPVTHVAVACTRTKT
jgi:hypothetical protein